MTSPKQNTGRPNTTPATRRVLALWLPHLPAERLELETRAAPAARPFAVWAEHGNRRLVAAANRAARQAGVTAGQALADARAIAADLTVAPADGAADARRLSRLAAWCRCYAPWTAPRRDHHGEGGFAGTETAAWGIWIETGGCAHLFGGEDAMCRAIAADLARAGHEVRAGLAGTPGAAWALARAAGGAKESRAADHRREGTAAMIAPPGGERAALAPLPVAALRLDWATVERLSALGLRRIGDLYPLVADGAGRAGLAQRFPPLLLDRLDAALGRSFEPIGPDREAARHIARLTLPEPVRDLEIIARLARRLTDALVVLLAREGLGARRIVLTAFRTDGRAARVALGTARPLAEADMLMRLLALRLPRLDAGPGADAFTLEAISVEPLRPRQDRLAVGAAGAAEETDALAHDAHALAPLVEKLAARLGPGRIGRLVARPNHLPERAQDFESALAAASPAAPSTAPDDAGADAGMISPARPLRLLAKPLPVAAAALAPDGPPAWFRWRGGLHRIARAEGPERIALDWWTLPGWTADDMPEGLADAVRDYWRVEDSEGARFWLFRDGCGYDGPEQAGAPERWYLHGLLP